MELVTADIPARLDRTQSLGAWPMCRVSWCECPRKESSWGVPSSRLDKGQLPLDLPAVLRRETRKFDGDPPARSSALEDPHERVGRRW